MRYVPNRDNLARTGTITATNIVPSTAITRTDSAAKAGGGVARLSGAYTGSADTAIDVEILDEAGTTRRISAPEFVGVGNGVLSGATAANTVGAQLVTITLEDLGIETRAAQAPFQSATLIAQATGDGGNAITVSVDSSGLTDAPTDFALQEELREGTNEYIGDQWNFNAAALNPDGTIPASAPRIRFGIDPQVYRQYRRYIGGRWVYSFTPSPVRSVPAGVSVKAVTGTRSITISNTVTTETITGVVSLFDALSGIRDQSALVRVEGAIVADYRPGGQGITDLSVYTRSYAASQTADGTEYARDAEFPVTVSPTAPTEVLTVRCIDASESGRERWRVRGQVSGTLADAITNTLYSAGPYGFTVPLVPSPIIPTTSNISALLDAPRSNAAERPTLCVEDAIVGAQAKAKTYEFVRRTRPPECPCETNADIEGGPDPDLLGIQLPVGASTMTEASRIIRVQRLAQYQAQFTRGNTSAGLSLGEVRAADVEFINRASQIFNSALRRVAGGTALWPLWAPSAPISADTVREPINRNGYRYAYSGGTTGATEPTWPTIIGSTVSDGSGVWTLIGRSVWAMWDAEFERLKEDTYEMLGTATAPAAAIQQWSPSFVSGPSVGRIIVPLTRNGHYYRHESGTGTGGASEPTWPTSGGTVVDGSLTWRDKGTYWVPSTVYAVGHVINPRNGIEYRCTVGGTSGATEPTWPPALDVPVTDGGVTWVGTTTIIGANLATAAPEVYFSRYQSAMNSVLAAAGVTPDFESAGLGGNNVWRDQGLTAWFECTSDPNLLPIQPGYYYHAAKLALNEDGRLVPTSTQEFGIGIDVPCQGLVDGDRLSIKIDLAGVARATYQQGDEFVIQINRAEPLALSGGQTGDDTQTWSVIAGTAGRLGNYRLDLTNLQPYAGLPAAWAAAVLYTTGAERRPTVANGRRYRATTGGTSAGTEPTWPTTIGATVVDGGVTWTCISFAADLGFAITPGAVPFALGDRYSFRVEGARAQWRQDGGAWSSPIEAAGTVSLTAGLSAVFDPGVAPSWVAGDRWSFLAEAINGPARALQPTDDALSWTGSTSITITPAAGAVDGLLIADHTIPADATITLQGSDDAFATVLSTQTVTWKARHIWVPIASPRLAYRLLANRGGSIRWLWVGNALQPSIPTGRPEIGALVRRYQLPGIGRRLSSGGTVRHTALTQAAVDDLVDALAWACDRDRRLIGVLISDSEVAVVRIPDDAIEVEDLFEHQPADINARRLSVSVDLEAVA
jgi:hypothetical protein